MSELRDYILSKLQEMTDQTPAENQPKPKPKPTPRIKPTRRSEEKARAAANKSKFGEILARFNAGVGAPLPKQNSSTDLRTQLSYVLADKLEEYRGEKFGYEPGEAPARGEKNPVKTAVGDALSKMRYGTTKPAEVEGGVIKDPGTRGGISTATRKKLGKLSATPRWKKIEGSPGMPKLPSRKKEESTNLKDRMVDILMEIRATTQANMERIAKKAGKPWANNPSLPERHKMARRLSSVYNKQPKVVKGQKAAEEEYAAHQARYGGTTSGHRPRNSGGDARGPSSEPPKGSYIRTRSGGWSEV